MVRLCPLAQAGHPERQPRGDGQLIDLDAIVAGLELG